MLLAPIVLFTYNRPEHTRITLEYLSKNRFATDSSLFIFCDGPKYNATDQELKKIEEVRQIVDNQHWSKNIRIIKSKKNKGLASSIISGVSQVLEKNEKVIVLEDDLITGKYFLDYMNQALDQFYFNQEVMQVSGFSFPINEKHLHSSYFLKLTTTWGWGTWKRVWDNIDFNCPDYKVLLSDPDLTYKFNFEGSYNYAKMFLQQMETNEISSWGIRFWWNVFKAQGLVLYPDQTLIKNIGWDGSGAHSDNHELIKQNSWDENYKIKNFPDHISENQNDKILLINLLKKEFSIKDRILKKIKSFFRQ